MIRTLDSYYLRRSLASVATLGLITLILQNVCQVAVVQAEETSSPADSASPFDFSYLPEQVFAFVAVRPKEIAADPRLQPLVKLLEKNLRVRVPSDLIEQATLALIGPEFDTEGRAEEWTGREHLVIQTSEPVDFEKILKRSYPTLTTEQHEARDLFVISPSPHTMSYFALDQTTLIGHSRTALLRRYGEANNFEPSSRSEMWRSEARGPVLVVVRGFALDFLFRQPPQHMTRGIRDGLAPVLDDIDTFLFSLEAGESIKLHGRLICKSPEEAQRVAETLDAVAVLTRNAVDVYRSRISEDSVASTSYKTILDFAENCLARRKVAVDGNDVRLEVPVAETHDVGRAVTAVVSMLGDAPLAKRQQQSMNNLKRLSLAMLLYENMYGKFPPAASTTYRPGRQERTSEHPHSWRVALLPFLDEHPLQDSYRFDEPWDSEANKKLLEHMPDVFRSPHDDPGSTTTSYFVFTGPATIFHDEEGTQLREITDGTSNTLMLVETKKPVPWTKPEDLPYAADQPLPELGGWVPGEFVVSRADGSVVRVSSDVDEETLRAWITKAGREVAPELPKPEGAR